MGRFSLKTKMIADADAINPTGVYSYVDALRVWLNPPLTAQELAWLRQQRGGKKMRVHDHRAPFEPRYQQRIMPFQPTQEVLQSLATRTDAHLNYLELSLDWTFDYEWDRDAAFEFICRYLVKEYHRDQKIVFVGNNGKITRYSGPRSAPNVLVVYADLPCRVNGLPYCVHLDWRIKGRSALRRAAINSVRDLLDLDYRQFWRCRLKFCEVDLRALGRKYCNWERGTKRREPWMHFSPNGRYAYDVHLRAGSIIVRARQSTQAVIDQHRNHFDVNSCLIRHEVPHLLPR